MNPDRRNARELLAFYLDAGVDGLVGEAPVDRFADEAQVSASPREGKIGRASCRERVSSVV